MQSLSGEPHIIVLRIFSSCGPCHRLCFIVKVGVSVASLFLTLSLVLKAAERSASLPSSPGYQPPVLVACCARPQFQTRFFEVKTF